MQSIKFLIIESDSIQREVLEYNIRMLGYTELISFDSITSAYSWLMLNGTVDILVCDLDLASTSLVFLKKISEKFNIGGVAFFSKVDIDLRHSIARVVELLGIKYLGDLRSSLLKFSLKEVISTYYFLRDNLRNQSDSDESKFSPSINELKVAIENCEFVSFYQPKYYLNSMEISGAEVLIRWKHPDYGILTPDLFLDKLIENNLLDDVFISIFKQSLKIQSISSENSSPVSLSYNLDIQQLSSTKFVRTLINIVREINVKPHLITFEITENNPVDNKKMLLKNLLRLRFLGFGLALDDFGSAYSSFSRLCEFPFTQIKLDKDFISNICNDQKYKMSLVSVVSLASMLNMNLIVEGIETEEQLNTLRNLGCLEGQGFYFCKPMSELDFINNTSIIKTSLGDKYLKSMDFI